ncbi:MAG: ribonuclease P protein component [Pseudomonadota bacterium]
MGAMNSPRLPPETSFTAGKPLPRLKKRADFLRAAKGARTGAPAFSLQRRERGDDDPTIRVGFTATKKMGGAVVRNRMKRRLRAAADLILPVCGRPGCDYVLVARPDAAARPFHALLDDLRRALVNLDRPRRVRKTTRAP